MRTISLAALLSLMLVPAALPAAAQTRTPPATPQPSSPSRPAAPAAAPTSGPAPAAPQQTTASFMDWTLRCSRLGPPPGTQFCEVAQGTILVPVNVTVAAPAALSAPGEGGAVVQELAWRRCLPGGCTADALLTDEAVQRMRAWNEPGRISFQDALGRTAVMPFSPRGLPQALDALAKEEGS